MSQQQMMQDIEAFHHKFGLVYEGQVRTLPKDLLEFRIKFMQEELDEYKEAAEAGDKEKQFDALIDLCYVALGTAYLQGLYNVWDEGWARVQRANMAKIRVQRKNFTLSKRQSPFDVVKPKGWVAPDLRDLV